MSSSVTAQIDHFSDEGFAIKFLEGIPQISLHHSKIVACDTVPLIVRGSGKGGVILFRLSVPSTGSPPITKVPIIGKFRHSIRDKETFEVARQLWENGFGAQSHLRICQPIAYLEESRLLLVYYAGGISLDEMLAACHESFASCVTQAGQWLAKLHHTATVGTRTRSVDDEIGKLEKTFERTAGKLLSFDGRSRWVVDEIVQRIASVNFSSFRLTHGDYLPKNILCNGSNVTVVDLGRVSIFDPAKDIGKFIGNMTIRAWKYATNFDTDDLRRRFLEGYAQEISTEYSQRIAAYEARSYIRCSARETFTDSALYWLRRAEDLLKA